MIAVTGLLATKVLYLLPAISPMSAPISDSPIITITVPVTSGGKNRSTIENGFRDQQPEDPRDDQRAVDVGHAVAAAVLVGDDDHRVEHGERRPGDHRQAHTHDLAD